MSLHPFISALAGEAAPGQRPFSGRGGSFVIEEWRGSGPVYAHVHHADDEAWHVLDGILRFHFPDGPRDAPAGTTVFVPAGVPHTYEAIGSARYLVILTPRLRDLIAELQGVSDLEDHRAIMLRYASEMLE